MHPVLDGIGPDAQFEAEPIRPDSQQKRLRGRRFAYMGMSFGDLLQDRENALRTRAVRNRYWNLHAALVARERPIDDRFRYQLAIRDDNLGAARGAHDACADTDALDNAGRVVHLHDIADLHRPFEEQDEPGDEIIEDVLQPEADTDGEWPGAN